MDAYVENKEVLFQEVFSHLEAVREEPQKYLLNSELLKRAERNLDAFTPRDLLWKVLRTGEALLQILQQDPNSLTQLLERVVLLIPFDELKSVISAQKLEEGLDSPSTAIQYLCLSYLRKAADSPSGAAFVAASSSLVESLVTTSLATENTGVAERAVEVIAALLTVDSSDSITIITAGNGPAQAQGQGLLWRRVFHDPQVYSLLYEWTSLKSSKRDIKTKKGLQAVTISQARLFDFIVRLAQIDWVAITTSSLPDIEAQYVSNPTSEQPYGGILRYAAVDMIDPDDYLMEVLRQDLFAKLLVIAEGNQTGRVPPRLIEAIQRDAGVYGDQDSRANGVHL